MDIIRTEEGFARIASGFMSTGTSHTAGDRVSKAHNMFNKDTIAEFIGLEVAKARCDAIDPTDFPEHEVPLRTLHTHVEAWIERRGDFLYL